MRFPSLDCSFGCVQSFVVRFDELYVTFFFGEELFDVFGCLFVHYINFDFESFLLELFKLLFVGFIYDDVGDW